MNKKHVKNLLLVAIVLGLGVWAISMKGHCVLESEKTQKAAAPIVEALAKYAEKNGIPNLDSFDQIEGIPYKLKPCSERPDLMECEVLEGGYYFKTPEGYFAIEMAGSPTQEKPKGFFLNIVHSYTDCTSLIYYDNQIENTYKDFSCSLIGKCSGWFRQ